MECRFKCCKSAWLEGLRRLLERGRLKNQVQLRRIHLKIASINLPGEKKRVWNLISASEKVEVSEFLYEQKGTNDNMQTNLTFELKVSLMKGNKWSFIDTPNLFYSTGAKNTQRYSKKIIYKLEYVVFDWWLMFYLFCLLYIRFLLIDWLYWLVAELLNTLTNI